MTTNNFITKSITSLLFFSLLCNCTVLKAQESTEATPYDDEWGLNITGFANQFLSFNGNQAPQGDYLLTYKKIKDDKAFRLGLGLDVNRVSRDEDNSVPFDQAFMAFDLRLGGEKRHDIATKWLFTTGFDVLLGANFSKFESFNNFDNGEQKNTNLIVGLGPVLGVHFRINQRISVGTESTLYVSYVMSKEESDNGDNGPKNTSKSSTIDLDLTPPFALYFSIRI